MKKIAAALAAVLVAGGLSLGAATAASADQPDFICSEAGYEAKVDTPDNPATVEYTAPAGKLVDSYCVKAGTEKFIVPVTPPTATVLIDHPEKGSVSHYQVHLIDAPVVPEKPQPVVVAVPNSTLDCKARTVTTITTTTTTDWKLVENVWVKGEPVVTTDAPGVTRAATEAECPTPSGDPEPVQCSVSGDWYTESDDVAPEATPEGLVFTTTGEGKAVGYRIAAGGNLQGWEPVSFTTTGDASQFFFRITVSLAAEGGPAYKSLSIPGDSTIDGDSVIYQTGGTIAQFAAEHPKAVITSIGFQTNSGAEAGLTTILTSIEGGCIEESFVPVKPAPVVTTVTDEDTDCEADEVTTTTTVTTTEYVWDAETASFVLGEPVDEVTTATREATDEECPVVVTPPTETPTPSEQPKPTTPSTVTPVASGLAETGFDMGPVYLFAGLGTLVIGAMTIALSTVALRRRNGDQ